MTSNGKLEQKYAIFKSNYINKNIITFNFIYEKSQKKKII